MKQKIVVIVLYALLFFVAFVVAVRWLVAFAFDDFINYYNGGILKWVFILIMLAGIILPILKYRKHEQKWILPMVLCIMMLTIPVFNNGILKIVEDDLKDFSKEKWVQHEKLRLYMLDDLETNHFIIGKTEESVKNLLGEPVVVREEDVKIYEYFVHPGHSIDPIMYQIYFENGVVVKTSKRYT